MLILQRKVGQSLVIGDDIAISVVSVDGNRVRLSISAPEQIPILRSELVKAAATNQDSAMVDQPLTNLVHALGGVLTQPKSIIEPKNGLKEDSV